MEIRALQISDSSSIWEINEQGLPGTGKVSEQEILDLLNYSSFSIALVRAISAIPLHASVGVIMGYYIALYVFGGSKKRIVQALLVPIFIHALYNYLTNFGLLLTLVYLFLTIRFAKSLHNEFIRNQKAKINEEEAKIL